MTNPLRRISVALALATVSASARAQQHGAQGASVSPDGKRILFTSDREGTEARYIMNADGSGLTHLTTPPGFPTGRAAWAADGAHILVPLVKGDTVHIFALPIPDGAPRDLGAVVMSGARTANVAADASRVLVGAGDWTKMQLYAATLGDQHQRASLPATERSGAQRSRVTALASRSRAWMRAERCRSG